MIEREGQLRIAFSGAKQTMEVLKVPLNELDRRIASEQEFGRPGSNP